MARIYASNVWYYCPRTTNSSTYKITMASKSGLYINRHRTLKEHRAAVKAQKEKKRLTGGTKPKTGEAATKALNAHVSEPSKPKPQPKPTTKPKPASVKPSTPPKPAPKPTPKKKKSSTGSFFDGGKGGKYDKGNTGGPGYAGVLPGTPEPKKDKPERRSARRGAAARRNRAKNKPQGPKKGDTKQIQVGSRRQTMIFNGTRWEPKKR